MQFCGVQFTDAMFHLQCASASPLLVPPDMGPAQDTVMYTTNLIVPMQVQFVVYSVQVQYSICNVQVDSEVTSLSPLTWAMPRRLWCTLPPGTSGSITYLERQVGIIWSEWMYQGFFAQNTYTCFVTPGPASRDLTSTWEIVVKNPQCRLPPYLVLC